MGKRGRPSREERELRRQAAARGEVFTRPGCEAPRPKGEPRPRPEKKTAPVRTLRHGPRLRHKSKLLDAPPREEEGDGYQKGVKGYLFFRGPQHAALPRPPPWCSMCEKNLSTRRTLVAREGRRRVYFTCDTCAVIHRADKPVTMSVEQYLGTKELLAKKRVDVAIEMMPPGLLDIRVRPMTDEERAMEGRHLPSKEPQITTASNMHGSWRLYLGLSWWRHDE